MGTVVYGLSLVLPIVVLHSCHLHLALFDLLQSDVTRLTIEHLLLLSLMLEQLLVLLLLLG